MPSHQGAAEWIDRAIGLVQPHAGQMHLRGDTDFSLTGKFDEWDQAGVTFALGMDASPTLVALAESLSEAQWRELVRAQPEIKTEPRERPENVKEQIVREREFINIRLESEQVAEFEYQPGKCQKSYRMVVLRKNLSIEKRGEAGERCAHAKRKNGCISPFHRLCIKKRPLALRRSEVQERCDEILP